MEASAEEGEQGGPVRRAALWLVGSPLAGLSPWIVYSLLSGPDRLELAAVIAFAIALAFFLIGRLRGTSVKMLEVTDVVFFGLLGIFVAFASEGTQEWLELWSGETVNVALVVIALTSIAIKQPFTMQYARDEVPRELWDNPLFIHINYVLTWAWVGAFVIGAASGLYGDAVLENSNNLWTGWVIQTAALVLAADFTGWYPKRASGKAALARGEEPDEPIPGLGELFDALAVWVLIVGILVLAFDGGPTWLGIALIVAGGAGQRVFSSDGPEAPS